MSSAAPTPREVSRKKPPFSLLLGFRALQPLHSLIPSCEIEHCPLLRRFSGPGIAPSGISPDAGTGRERTFLGTRADFSVPSSQRKGFIHEPDPFFGTGVDHGGLVRRAVHPKPADPERRSPPGTLHAPPPFRRVLSHDPSGACTLFPLCRSIGPGLSPPRSGSRRCRGSPPGAVGFRPSGSASGDVCTRRQNPIDHRFQGRKPGSLPHPAEHRPNASVEGPSPISRSSRSPFRGCPIITIAFFIAGIMTVPRFQAKF